MLVLSRKNEEQILIGSDITVTVLSVTGNKIKVGIEAPQDVRILRKEILSDDVDSWDKKRKATPIAMLTSGQNQEVRFPR